MPEISIILPSLREKEVLERIKEFEITNGNFDYEIIVVSPFLVKGKKVIHIFEDKPRGVPLAYNSGYKDSSGQYICWWSDDISPTKNCLLNMVNFLKTKKPPFIGAFRIKDKKGIEHSQWKVYGKLYACWGSTSRKTINIIGKFFDPIFKCYFADPDLSLRVWEKRGEVEVCPDAWIISHGLIDKIREENQRKYFSQDFETFLNRWHEIFGEGLKRDFYSVNKPDFQYEGIIKISPSFTQSFLIKFCEWLYSNSRLRSNSYLMKILRKIRYFQ